MFRLIASALLSGLVALGIPAARSSGRPAEGVPTAHRGAANGAIFFSGAQGGMAINVDGSGLVKLRHPGLMSPDGTRVIVGGTGIVNLDGSGRRVVFRDDEAYDLAWSPDSQSIAYRATSGADFEYLLYRFDLATGKKTRLTEGPGDSSPTWSPDSRSIAFIRNTSLYVMNADGSRERKLADNATDTISAAGAWEPNGRRFAFKASEGDTLDIVDADGANRRTLVAGIFEPEFAWAPDGTKLAFSGLVGDRVAAFVIDRDGSGRTRLADVPGSGDMSAPVWSPDGTRIALSFGTPDDVWVVNVNGKGRKRLTKAIQYGGANSDPVWDPVGRRTSQLPGARTPHAGSTETVTGSRLLRTKRAIAAIAADGFRVAYVLGNVCPEIESWSPGRRVTVFQATSSVDCDAFVDAGIVSVAMAGSRVAWIPWQQNNHLYIDLVMATIARPNPFSVVSEYDVEIDRLRGDGSTFVFTTHPDRRKVWRFTGNRVVHIATRANISGIALAANSIAHWSRRRVEITDLDGRRRIVKEFRDLRGVALTERNLAVLDGDNLEVYEASRGRHVRSWSLKGWRLVDADGDLAVLVRRGAVQVIRLSDGRRRTFTTPNAAMPLADLERPGLFYAYNMRHGVYPGRIVFIGVRDLA
jgi:dipeptidyl aminopeptidase/acylaminoacyl peptidase